MKHINYIWTGTKEFFNLLKFLAYPQLWIAFGFLAFMCSIAFSMVLILMQFTPESGWRIYYNLHTWHVWVLGIYVFVSVTWFAGYLKHHYKL